MSYFHDHQHTKHPDHPFQPRLSPQRYAAVVGVVQAGDTRPIEGEGGDHLQFYLTVGEGARWQVDVNTQSIDGSEVGVYIADEPLDAAGGAAGQPFGAPAYGVDNEAQLSYAGLGLKDLDFRQIEAERIEAELEAALSQSSFVSVYGAVFQDPTGDGVHDVHYTGRSNQDGALAVYVAGEGAPKRTWFFFKFANQSIGQKG